MAKVQLCSITVMDNPSAFSNPFQFEITFECIEELKEDLEWKMIYVGSAESEEYDQILDSVYVGPIPEGRHMFVFQADPPNVSRIPENDAIGVTVVLLTCSYRAQEFIRVGYFINNEYTDPEMRENPPSPPQFDKVVRNILASEPRVTRFKINWEEPNALENGAPSTGEGAAPTTSTSGMDDLEWKMIYVGSAESEEYDQILDSVYVEPLPECKHMFVFKADPLNVSRILENDTRNCGAPNFRYRAQEFMRVGYFINNEYTNPEIRGNPPSPPEFDIVVRNILASKPRVTRFKINWEEPNALENGAASNGEGTATPTSTSGMDGVEPLLSSFNDNLNSWATMECS